MPPRDPDRQLGIHRCHDVVVDEQFGAVDDRLKRAVVDVPATSSAPTRGNRNRSAGE
ncbi:hypothetical protein I552_7377 [Mycobacterium xenopi 3993]|nr:hypothetical protein I552_7377 [Mycobacterium xenopi 3993]